MAGPGAEEDVAELGLDPSIQTPRRAGCPDRVVLVAVSITDTVLGTRTIGIGDIGEGFFLLHRCFYSQ